MTAVESATLAGGAAAGAKIGGGIGLTLAPATGGSSVPVLTVVGGVGGGIAGTFITNKTVKNLTGICD